MIYYFAGDNRFAIKQEVNKFVTDFKSKYSDLALERFDGEDSSPDAIIGAVGSLPFLSPAKMVVIDNANDKELIAQIIDAKIPDKITVIVLITKVDKRLAYYKKISKAPNFKLFEQKNANVSANWVVGYVKDSKGKITVADANYLLQRVGVNQIKLSNELDKLLTYNSEITRSNIDLLTEPTPDSSVFQLLDSAFAGNKREVERLYKEQRTQNIEPQQIIGSIAWQLHLLAVVKVVDGKSAESIARDLKAHPFPVKKAQGLAKNMTLNKVKQIIDDAQNLDLSIKTKNIDADRAIILYLLSLSVD